MNLASRATALLATFGIAGFQLLGSFQLASAVSLGAAGGYALLEIGSGTVATSDTDQVNVQGGNTISGNIGVAAGANLQNTDHSTTINGSIFLATGATYSGPNPNNVSGAVNTNQNLSAAVIAALTLSTLSAGMSATGSISNLDMNLTNITPGVYNFSSNVNLTQQDTWTLNGAGDYIFNFSGNFGATNKLVMNLTGGASAQNVLFNILGSGDNSFTNTNLINAIILAPNGNITVNGGSTVNGELISGENITLASHANINEITIGGGNQTATPLPAALPLFAAGLGAMGLLGWRRKRKGSAAGATSA